MNVRELIVMLSECDLDSEVIMSKDGEGNSYSPLFEIDSQSVCIPNSTWSREIYHMSWSAEDACMSDEKWEEIRRLPKCVVLWPVN